MRLNKKGYSLMELIVVMAILVVIAGGSIVGVSLITSRPCERAAQTLSECLKQTRMDAMGFKSSEGELYYDSDQLWYVEKADGSEIKKTILCDKKVDAKVNFTDSSSVNLSASLSQKFNFDRASGALKPELSGKTISSIIISRGNDSFTISFSPLTGRVDISRS